MALLPYHFYVFVIIHVYKLFMYFIFHYIAENVSWFPGAWGLF